MTPDEAVEIVARQAMALAAAGLDWQDYPDLGEDDFNRVCTLAALRYPFPNHYEQAYALLAARTADEENPDQ